MIGIGLGNPKDVTIKGLETIQRADKVFLENYTSIQNTKKEEYEEFFQKKIEFASRDLVEKQAKHILNHAENKAAAFLVVGDVFQATTHTDLYLRAKKQGINVEIIQNAGIFNAASQTGLQLYKFGKTTSIVFNDEGWLPKTPYETIKNNKKLGLHTLCLLDIKVAEPSRKDLLKGKNTPQPPRYMTINKAITILEQLENKHKENIIHPKKTKMIGLARMGTDNYMRYATMKHIQNHDFKKPLHSLILPGNIDEVEKEMLQLIQL